MRNHIKSISVSICLVVCTISFGCADMPRKPYAFKVIQEEIRQGDLAFEIYDYNSALHHYEKASSQLSDLVAFEIYPTSKHKSRIERKAEVEMKRRSLRFHADAGHLQRYVNTMTFVEARIELTKIAITIGQLESDHTPNDLERK